MMNFFLYKEGRSPNLHIKHFVIFSSGDLKLSEQNVTQLLYASGKVLINLNYKYNNFAKKNNSKNKF